jgi:hypothetical protein
VLAEHFGASVQVLTTDSGDIAVISRRVARPAATQGALS